MRHVDHEPITRCCLLQITRGFEKALHHVRHSLRVSGMSASNWESCY
jgi:hypothetical protein